MDFGGFRILSSKNTQGVNRVNTFFNIRSENECEIRLWKKVWQKIISKISWNLLKCTREHLKAKHYPGTPRRKGFRAMRDARCAMRDARNARCAMRDAQCAMRDAQCAMRSPV